MASTRSNAVGVPPRWMCPSTVARVSKPVRSLDLALEQLADAAEALVPELVLVAADRLSSVPSFGVAPSAATTIEK